MLISLHTAKAAGTSFRQILTAHYGTALYADYRDKPFNTPRPLRELKAERYRQWQSRWELVRFRQKGIRCIHGHFLPYKYSRYLKKNEVYFVTWLREPLERLVSQYEHWQRTYRPGKSLPLQRKVVEEKWDIERFLLAPELQNMYAQYLYRFPLQNFDFVGLTEFFAEDLRIFTERFWGEAPLVIPRENLAPQALPHIDGALRERARVQHRLDYEIYEQALRMRNQP